MIAACRSDEDANIVQADIASRFERILLTRLSKTAIGEMIAGMLALDRAPPQFNEFLYRESNGNPFVVAEYLRAAIDQGLLQRDASGRWQLGNAERKQALSLSLVSAPISVQQLMQRRISSLAPPALSLARAAALLGRDFDASLLDILTGGEASVELETLRNRQIFEEGHAGRLRFAHDQLRDLAYRSIPVSEVVDLHRRAALALEQNSQDPITRAALLPMLAQQWSLAGVRDRAASYHVLAGDRAREVYANEEALRHYVSALEAARTLADDPSGEHWSAVVRQLEERRADLLILVGRNAAARASLRNALDGQVATARLARSRLLWKFARTLELEHDHARALNLYREAEQALGECRSNGSDPLPPEWPINEPPDTEGAYWEHAVKLQVEQIWVHYWLADVEAMTTLVERIRPMIEKHGNPHQRARFLQAIIHNNLRRERYAVSAQTVELARASLAAAEMTLDANAIAYAEFVLAFQLLFLGALGEAETHMNLALADAERTGDRALQARCLTYLTVAYRRRGDTARVSEFSQRSLEVVETVGMEDYVGAARANLGWVAWQSGNVEQSLRETEGALEHWERLRPKYPYPFQWLGRLHRIAVALAVGASDAAVVAAQLVLEPLQHRLPDVLSEAFSEAVAAWAEGDAARCDERMHAGLRAARNHGYL